MRRFHAWIGVCVLSVALQVSGPVTAQETEAAKFYCLLDAATAKASDTPCERGWREISRSDYLAYLERMEAVAERARDGAARNSMRAAAAQDATEVVVLRGVPLFRVTSSMGESADEVLPENRQQEFRLIVTRQGDRYFWASRDQMEVVHQFAGAFHDFVRPGTGMIRVLDFKTFRQLALSQGLDESMVGRALESFGMPAELAGLEGVDYFYMEVLVNGLSTVTYWGVIESADLPPSGQE